MRYAVIDEKINDFYHTLVLMGYSPTGKDAPLFASLTELNIQLVDAIKGEIEQ